MSHHPGRGDEYADVPTLITRMRAQRSASARERSRADIIDRCLPLADHVARRFIDRGEPFDDLRQAACVGLVHAVDRFDPTRGGSFLAFAVPTVVGEVRKHFRDTTWAMRVPRRLKDNVALLSRASDELSQRLGRSPRPSEIAAYLGVPKAEVVETFLARSAYQARSLDSGRDDDTPPIAETHGSDDEWIGRIDEFVTLRPAIRSLPERERRILALRFVEGMSQTEIAAAVGISQMHVSRLLTRSLSVLREQLSTDP